jgi:dGTPase
MIGAQVIDLVETSRRRIEAVAPRNVDAVRAQPQPLIAFSDQLRGELKALKDFLMANLYRHYRVMRMSNKADRVVSELFDVFMNDPRLLPPAARIDTRDSADEAMRAQSVADYIAGMTDRYAIAEHRRIFVAGELT